MILRNQVLISVLVAAAATAACQSSDDAAPVNGASGAPAEGGRTGGGQGGTAPVAHAGAGGKAQAQAGSGGRSAQAGGEAGGASPEHGSDGPAGASGAPAAGAAGDNGDDGSAGQGGAPDEPREVAYLGTVLGGLFTSSVNPVSGAPTKLGDPIAKNRNVAALAVDAQQRFLYVAEEQQRVAVYRIGADGTLPAQPTSSVATPADLNSLLLDPLGRFAYVGSVVSSSIYTFEIDPDSGALSPIGEPLVVGDGAHGGGSYLAAEPTGHFVYVSSSFGFGIAGYKINPTTGALTVLDGSPFGATGIPGGNNVFGGALAIKPSGDFLYAAGGALNAFAIATNGALSLVDGSPFTLDIQSDADATNVAIDPQGRYLYTTHFFGNNHIHGFKIDPRAGSLAEVPNSPFTGNTPYSVAVAPNGRFLYVGVDEANGLDAYTIRRSDGSLARVDGAPYAIGGLEPALAFATLPKQPKL